MEEVSGQHYKAHAPVIIEINGMMANIANFPHPHMG